MNCEKKHEQNCCSKLFEKWNTFPFRGIIYAIISGFFLSSGAAFVKQLHGIFSLEIIIFRDLVQIIISLIFIVKERSSLWGIHGERKYLLSRGSFGTVSMSCWFTSVKLTVFGDAAAIYYSYPAFIALLAYIFLKEPFGWFNFIVIIATVAGILCVSGPRYILAIAGDSATFSQRDLAGIILASIGCVAVSCGNLSIRKIEKTPSNVVVLWFSVISMVSSIILVPILDHYVWPTGYDEWLMLLAVGICGWLTQVFITLAMKAEMAAPVSVTEGFNMIIAFLYQAFIFHEPISWTSGLGALIITISVISVGVKKWLHLKSEKPAATVSPTPAAEGPGKV